jgi:multidrug resistance efflux pump
MTETKLKIVTLMAAATCAVAGAALLPGCGGDAPGEARTVEVRRGSFELVVSENCEFRPLNSFVALSRASDKLDWIIAEGTEVKRGDLVFTLDRTWTNEWLARDTNEFEAARRNLKEVRRQVQMERDELRLDIKSRESAVSLAKTRLESVLAGPTDVQLQEAQAALRASETEARDKRAGAESAAKLAKQGFLSEAEAEKESTAAELAAIELERRKLRFKQLKDGASREHRKIAEQELARSRVQLEMAKANVQRREAQLAGRISDARSRVASLERSVARAKRAIESRQVKSHGAGVVIHRQLHWHHGGKPEVGSRVWSGCGVLDVADIKHMKVRTQLAERYVRYLKVGSRINVRPDPLPGTVMPASVTWIDRWSLDRSADLAKADRQKEGLSGVKVFALEAAVKGSDLRIKPGFKGKAEFTLVTIPEALIAPVSAVFGSGEERFVLRVDGREVNRVGVEVVADDGLNAALRGKLDPGQRLLTRESL